MRRIFDEELHELNQELITMGMYCENAIEKASKALENGDIEQAREFPTLLEQITDINRDIENFCIRILLQQQPVARDLRTVSSALKMVTDMERIGVQSADIAEIVTMANISEMSDTSTICKMAEAAVGMVKEAIDAFVSGNVDKARAVVERDDVVDNYFDEVKTFLIGEFARPDANGETVLDMLMIAKYFERIADHAVNIAQWVIYSITGEHKSGT